MPASSSAASTASAARRSSLRPESLENSVAPMPTIATCRRRRAGAAHCRLGRPPGRAAATRHGAGDVVAEPVGAPHGDVDEPRALVGLRTRARVTDPVRVMVSPG